jgi:hypothetical protein
LCHSTLTRAELVRVFCFYTSLAPDVRVLMSLFVAATLLLLAAVGALPTAIFEA